MMFWYDHNLSTWGWIGMTSGMVLFWALIIATVAWLVRGSRGNQEPYASRPTDPQQLLAERFARGEIDEAEYQDRLATLGGQRHPAARS